MSLRKTLLLACIVVIQTPGVASAFFADSDVSWYREDIGELTRAGILQGYPDGTFRPRQFVNRAEFVKVLLKDDAHLHAPERRCFPDVPLNEWYAPYVCTAKERGIVSGQRGGLFQPEAEMNMAEALKMLLLARDEHVAENRDTQSPWYLPYLDRAAELGIAGRYSYTPWERVRRERMASLLARSRREEQTGRPGNLSAGCFATAPDAVPSSLEVGGVTRQFILAIPDSYSPRAPHPLVVAFHGRTNSNEAVRDYYRLEQQGLDAIVAYPAGMRRMDGTYSWSDPGDSPSSLRDMRLFDELTKEIAETYCVDWDRVFVAGHSLGAWFANSIGCIYGGVVRGTAAVAGQPSAGTCASPAAGLFLHDPRDQLVRIADGIRSRDQRATQNACRPDLSAVAPESLGCKTMDLCQEGQPVHWCEHDEGGDNGHQWPRTAGRVIADFFRNLP